ncbi:E3 ubiquitin-protein ligase Mdm2 [Polymixia lowei]
MSADNCLNTEQNTEDNKLVRPKVEFHSLLQDAGATKEVFTMKEVMFYLGQYIMQKQLYDQTQQHIVHCSHDALGRVLGVESFSVKEPRVLFAMITKNLVAVKSAESSSSSTEQHSHSETDRGTEELNPESSSSPERSRRRCRRSRRSSDPGPSVSLEEVENDEEEEEEGRKRRRSDSYSLTFDDSLSWCVIGGLRNGQDRHSSQSSDTHSTSGRSEVSDNFSVEFEVESIDSDDYDDEDASLSGEDQVYELTIFEAGDGSSDEDTEITEADYWRCVKCEEFNPPLPRNCNRCWALRQDWLPEVSVNRTNSSGPEALPPKPSADQLASDNTPGVEEIEGVDVPDGKRAKTPLFLSSLSDSSPSHPDSQDLLPSSLPCSSSQETLCSPDPLPSSSSKPDSQDLLLPSSLSSPAVPDLERYNSLEARLPDSCLEPCVICQTRPKNGCIVHGRTGHLMACYTCARKLKKRNKLCPVCREPIQTVVLTYLS